MKIRQGKAIGPRTPEGLPITYPSRYPDRGRPKIVCVSRQSAEGWMRGVGEPGGVVVVSEAGRGGGLSRGGGWVEHFKTDLGLSHETSRLRIRLGIGLPGE